MSLIPWNRALSAGRGAVFAGPWMRSVFARCGVLLATDAEALMQVLVSVEDLVRDGRPTSCWSHWTSSRAWRRWFRHRACIWRGTTECSPPMPRCARRLRRLGEGRLEVIASIEDPKLIKRSSRRLKRRR
jgi:hypothetical protein